MPLMNYATGLTVPSQSRYRWEQLIVMPSVEMPPCPRNVFFGIDEYRKWIRVYVSFALSSNWSFWDTKLVPGISY
jgi:hypothetical protein